ncbi:MAG TPA: signal peptide peptidase SppA [Acidobacteriota bacterium]|nr:signal peptide peptidase SppA [Acidobacteriota bacterium]
MARRRSSWTWVILGFLLLVLLFWWATQFLNRAVLGQRGSLGADNVLEVSLVGQVVERPAYLWGSRSIGPLSIREIDNALRRAADDPRVSAALLRVGPMLGGFAKAQEIRSAVHAFRESGKPVVALLEIGTLIDLYVASSANTLVQVPTGSFVLGLAARTQYYRELLDKLGVEFEAFATGPYKSAMNPYTETGMSDEERVVLESLLDSVYEQILNDVAEDRGLDRTTVQAAIDRGILPAATALESGLVDELGFYDGLDDALGIGSTQHVGVREYWELAGPGWGIRRPAIALVHIDGLILPGDVSNDPLGGAVAGGDTIARAIRQARQNASVRAIVLRVDSPGGAVTASDVIWREAALAAESMPVIVSMSDVAASGGYWIATAGTRVLADGATYTGSIGVTMGRYNLAGAYEKLGIANDAVTRGENAGLFLDSRRLSPSERGAIEASITETYQTFLDKVADARDLSVAEVERLAAGRVWTGQQALEVGLVDEIGGLRAALSAARRAAGIDARTEVDVRLYPAQRTMLEQVSGLLTGVRAGPASVWMGNDVVGPIPDTAALAGRVALLRLMGSAGARWAVIEGPVPTPVR